MALLGYALWTKSLIANPASDVASPLIFVNGAQLSGGDFAALVRSDGADIRATTDPYGQNQIPCYAHNFTSDGTDCTGGIWVRWPDTKAATGSDHIYLWANGVSDAPAADSDFGRHAVFRHMRFFADGGGNDLSEFGSNLTMSGSPSVGGVAGPIDGLAATDYNGSTQYGTTAINIPTSLPLTLVTWFNVDNVTSFADLITLSNSSASSSYLQLTAAGIISGDPVRATTRFTTVIAADSATGYTASTWRMGIARFESATSRYGGIDGVMGAQNTSLSTPAGLSALSLGALLRDGGPVNFLPGLLSSSMVFTSVLSDDHIAYLSAMIDPADTDQSSFYGAWEMGEILPLPDTYALQPATPTDICRVNRLEADSLPLLADGTKLCEYNIGGLGRKSRLRVGDSTSALAHTGDRVGWVEDVSGLGRHLSLSVGNGAVVDAPRILPRRALHFLGDVSGYTNSSSITTNTLTVAVAITMPRNERSHCAVVNFPSRMACMVARSTNYLPWGTWQDPPGWTTGSSLLMGKPYVLVWQFKSGRPVKLWKNGELDFTGSSNHTFTTLPSGISLGRGNSDTERFIGHVAYMSAWSGETSEAKIRAFSRALMQSLAIENESVYQNFTIADQLTITGGNQGYCTDGTNHFLSGTSIIEKYDSSWNLLDSINPLTTGQDHCGALAHYNGQLFAVTDKFNGNETPTGQERIFWCDTNLGNVGRTAVLTETNGHAALTIVPGHGSNGMIYVANYLDGSITRYDLSTKAFIDNIPTTIPFGWEGIAYKAPYFYLTRSIDLLINDDNGGAIYIAHEDAIDRPEFFASMANQIASFGKIQGLDYSTDTLRVRFNGGAYNLLYLELH